MWESKWNENKTAIHLKVTHAIQKKISSNVNKLALKEIKRTSEEVTEIRNLNLPFQTFVYTNPKKMCLYCNHTENELK